MKSLINGMKTMKYKVYDRVWKMSHDKPHQFLVYAVVEEMAFFKTEIDIRYKLVSETCGATWEKAVSANGKDLFDSKEELVASL